MKIYHGICSGNEKQIFNCPKPFIMSENELRARFPLLSKKYKWAVVYYDGEMDDSRVALESIFTASIDNYNKGKNLK